MPARPAHLPARRRSAMLLALTTSLALIAAACSRGGTTEQTSTSADPVTAAQARVDDAEQGVTAAEQALTTAHQSFCGTATIYVESLDRYGRVSPIAARPSAMCRPWAPTSSSRARRW